MNSAEEAALEEIRAWTQQVVTSTTDFYGQGVTSGQAAARSEVSSILRRHGL